MNIDLLRNDVSLFLKKYVRFMSKSVYISLVMYERFLKQYQYLYFEVVKNRYLFESDKEFGEIIAIYEDRYAMLGFHNNKYLQEEVRRYIRYFNSCDYRDKLSYRFKKIILCEECQLFVVQEAFSEYLIKGKMDYLRTYKGYQEGDFLLLCGSVREVNRFRSLCDLELVWEIFEYLESLANQDYACVKEEEGLLDRGEDVLRQAIRRYRYVIWWNVDVRQFGHLFDTSDGMVVVDKREAKDFEEDSQCMNQRLMKRNKVIGMRDVYCGYSEYVRCKEIISQ